MRRISIPHLIWIIVSSLLICGVASCTEDEIPNNDTPSQTDTITPGGDTPTDSTYYTLNVLSNNDEWGSATGSGTYADGTTVNIEAIPNVGYSFIKWSDEVESNPRTLIVSSNLTLYALFIPTDTTGPGGDTPDGGFDENGASYAVFSVSATKKVRFSKGNLQYQASTNSWRFAEHQYDYIGNDNINISSSYSGWIDLFGWGTSGWSGSSAAYYHPWDTASIGCDNRYGPRGNYDLRNGTLGGDFANADWGVYNSITNGGNQQGMWRTLTQGEWDYLCYNRSNADRKKGHATIDGKQGIVLLPDNWIAPPGTPDFNTYSGEPDANVYSIQQWQWMEDKGAIFLPCAGYRNGAVFSGINIDGSSIYYAHNNGRYWSATSSSTNKASSFSVIGYLLISEERHWGYSVRFVKDYVE